MLHVLVTEDGQVELHTKSGSIPLNDSDCEALLDLLEPIDGHAAACLYNEVYDAHRAAGGFERVTSRRRGAA